MLSDYYVLQVDGISIVGQVFLPDAGAPHPLVCLCHGVPSGGPPEPGDGGYPELAERICREGYAVTCFNFRGAGDSGGNIDLAGWSRDLAAVIDYLLALENVDRARLYLVGFSAGAAVSVYLASRDGRVAGVAGCACPADITPFTAENTWESLIEHFRGIGAIRDADFPQDVGAWVEGFRGTSPQYHVAGIAPRPLLLVHGGRDDLVPLNHARRLYRLAGRPKKLVVLEEAGHRLRREEGAVAAILDWLKAAGAGRRGRELTADTE